MRLKVIASSLMSARDVEIALRGLDHLGGSATFKLGAMWVPATMILQ